MSPQINAEESSNRLQQQIGGRGPRCCCCQSMSLQNSPLQSVPTIARLCPECAKAGCQLSDFGECPICHGNDGCRTIGGGHWSPEQVAREAEWRRCDPREPAEPPF